MFPSGFTQNFVLDVFSRVNKLSTKRTFRRILIGLLAIGLLLLIGGCASDPVLIADSLQLISAHSQESPPGIKHLASDMQVNGTASIVDKEEIGPESAAMVTVRNSRVNIRIGPGLEYQSITTATAGTAFMTYGRTANGWWRICCLQGVNDQPDQPTQPAWISEQVVDANADATDMPVLESLFPNTIEAVWDVDYRCGSDQCAEQRCKAIVETQERRDLESYWLILDREIQWMDGCGQNSAWRHQLDRYDGRDLHAGQSEVFLTDYWLGAAPGPANSIFTDAEGREVIAWCNDQLTGELKEADGWLNTYEGVACYDTRTGMLLSMSYVKRWLFSGEHDGEQYERAYLGDFEMYEVTLNRTNIELAFQ